MKAKNDFLELLKKEICPNIYFTPPEDQLLKYPACVVVREDFNLQKANNKPYMTNMGYKITYMSKDSSDNIFTKITSLFRFASFRAEYKVDGLYHKVFVVYE